MHAHAPTVLTRNRALHMMLVQKPTASTAPSRPIDSQLASQSVKAPEMDAGDQKILQDAVAALLRNDSALKFLSLSELRACSWPARALRLFLGAVVTVGTECRNAVL
jgi:hypothetical protein